MGALREIVNAYDVEKVSETYRGNVEITDLRDELGTEGHVLVVRGDLAYKSELREAGLPMNLANPKFWVYENLISSERIQKQLRENPGHSLFDGVGFSSLEALGYHANKIWRRAIVVMAHELVPDSKVRERYNIKIIPGDLPAEQGYVEKEKEVLSVRKDLIPLHQALYGARSMAPVGNKVADRLEEMCITPDATFFCVASGSNLYGIGHKIKQRFGGCETIVVEPEKNRTINPLLDLSNKEEVRDFARRELSDYTLDGWDQKHSGALPLHVGKLNRYILTSWAHDGNTRIDKAIGVSTPEVLETQENLKNINRDYHWTQTTALTLTPAIELAKQGKDVLVMAYGKYRKPKVRRMTLDG